jgi:hypothetical protein
MEAMMRNTAVLLALLAVAGCTTANGASRIGEYVNPCSPNNVPPDQRASLLHQDRPGGSDCSRETAQRAYEAPPASAPSAPPAPLYPRY